MCILAKAWRLGVVLPKLDAGPGIEPGIGGGVDGRIRWAFQLNPGTMHAVGQDLSESLMWERDEVLILSDFGERLRIVLVIFLILVTEFLTKSSS